ncbi:MAG TPA: YbdD/YjiX family protein [Gammaproteobacteria bacterium]|nr:YbdD/YjiX family protein [Gammaproteobacteria bacterium]
MVIADAFRAFWRLLRRISGDDAYDRYLAHWHAHHAGGGAKPLSRAQFFKAEQERKWDGIRRCC